MKKLAVLFSLAAALAVAAPVVAQARHGADDPSVELRHGADDPAGDDKGGARRTSTAKAVLQRSGTDDPTGDDRGGHGRGGDDGPKHT